MAALGERDCYIEQRSPASNDSLSANRVVVARAHGAVILWNGIATVKRVIKAAPAGVRGVERVTRIRERHNELRSGNVGDLFIHIAGANRKILDCWQSITNLSEKAFVVRKVQRLAVPAMMISIDPRLERITDIEQLTIAGSEIAHQIG